MFWGLINKSKYQNNIFLSYLDTEIWEFEAGNNNVIDPSLPDWDYAYGIALFVVDADFCKK